MRCLGDLLYVACLGALAGCVAVLCMGQADEQTWLVTILLMALAVVGMVFVFLFDPGGDT